MKATGIVRRIEARVIITPKPESRINTGFFNLNCKGEPFSLPCCIQN